MARSYSIDLQDHVVTAVEDDGMSCHAAASRFGVAVRTAIKWMQRYRRTGSVAPGQMGGHKPRIVAGLHRDWLIARCGPLLRHHVDGQELQLRSRRQSAASNLPPVPRQPPADVMPAGNLRETGAWPLNLGDDAQLPVNPPVSPPFNAGDDLHRHARPRP
jgi:transposase-like protein